MNLALLRRIIVSVFFIPTWLFGFPKIYSHKAVHNFITDEYYTSGDHTGGANCKGEIRLDNKASWDFSYENIKKAFELGADYVEVDTRITKDNVPILFHDKKLDCLTNLSGLVSEYKYDYLLKNLAPNHKVYFKSQKISLDKRPFFNKGKGQILSLEKLLRLFPNKKFLLNPKNKSDQEIEAYEKVISKFPNATIDIWGPQKLYWDLKKKHKNIRNFIDNHWQTDRCLKPFQRFYPWFGWLGYFPKSCKNRSISVSDKNMNDLSGWPNDFIEAFHKNNSKVYLFLPDPLPREVISKIIDAKIDGIIVTDIKKFNSKFIQNKKEN